MNCLAIPLLSYKAFPFTHPFALPLVFYAAQAHTELIHVEQTLTGRYKFIYIVFN